MHRFFKKLIKNPLEIPTVSLVREQLEKHRGESAFEILVILLSSLHVIDSSERVTPRFGLLSPFIHRFFHVVRVKGQRMGGPGPNIIFGSKPGNVV